MKNLIEKITANGRVSFEEALSLENAGFFDYARLADVRGKAMGLGNEVGYIVNRMINFSNICDARCKFCAFHARAGVIEEFTLGDDEILAIADDAAANGALQIMLQGGLNGAFTLDWACGILRKLKGRHPKIFLHVFSPSEVVRFAGDAGIGVNECVRLLKEAGAGSIPGAADILVERVRMEMSPLKSSVGEWTSVMRALAANGMYSSATMTFGIGESFEERLRHLDLVRSLQDELGVFKAFICWPLAPENTRLEHLGRVGAPEFLKMIALARIYLDNVSVIQSGWLTEGMKVAEVAISMGANDMGGVLMDELVVKSAGIENATTANQMRDTINAAGKIPFARGGLYEKL
jgi:cyclic dehypoxanthinyl futalosine synthase